MKLLNRFNRWRLKRKWMQVSCDIYEEKPEGKFKKLRFRSRTGWKVIRTRNSKDIFDFFLVKLKIPRGSLVHIANYDGKCRADKVIPLRIWRVGEGLSLVEVGGSIEHISSYGPDTLYKIGSITKPNMFTKIPIICGEGIHFYFSLTDDILNHGPWWWLDRPLENVKKLKKQVHP